MQDLVYSRPNRRCLGMLHGKLIQPVIVLSASLAKLAFAKREIAECVQTGSDAQGFR